MPEVNLLTIFLTGLLTGGLSCMAVQGGLLASSLAQREKEKLQKKSIKKDSILPILSFLGAKLIAYTLLGFLLGWFGSLFQLSLTVQIIMQFAVAIFMIGTALSILDVHPIFRYFVIQPPKFLTRIVRKQSRSGDLFAPGLLGFLTIFIPCGTTQAMMALAIASGNPLLGAAILFAFVIGTAPIFFILGYFATKLSGSLHGKFMRFAAVAIFILALFNLKNALSLSGVNFSLKNLGVTKTIENIGKTSAGTEATINIDPVGYTPSVINLKKNSAVTINLVNKNSLTCAAAFTIPTYGIQRTVAPGTSIKIQFTTPKNPTQIAFMCAMGMYSGYINVL